MGWVIGTDIRSPKFVMKKIFLKIQNDNVYHIFYTLGQERALQFWIPGTYALNSPTSNPALTSEYFGRPMRTGNKYLKRSKTLGTINTIQSARFLSRSFQNVIFRDTTHYSMAGARYAFQYCRYCPTCPKKRRDGIRFIRRFRYRKGFKMYRYYWRSPA